jgi:hypothetical protein
MMHSLIVWAVIGLETNKSRDAIASHGSGFAVAHGILLRGTIRAHHNYLAKTLA